MNTCARSEFDKMKGVGRAVYFLGGKRNLVMDVFGQWSEVEVVEDKPTPLHDEVIKEIQNMNQEMDDILTRMVSDLDLMIKNAKYGNAIMKRTIKVITEGQG